MPRKYTDKELKRIASPNYTREMEEKVDKIKQVHVLPPGFRYTDEWSCGICRTPNLGINDSRPAFLCKRCDQIFCLMCYRYDLKVCKKCVG
jgi:hypothetical protein